MDINLKRNIILVGHAHSGKTSLSECMLFKAGAISRKGTVPEGNTVSDYSEDEIERKISISSSFLNFKIKEYAIQVIDTPGYADFEGEVISSCAGVDSAIVVIDAVTGVEVGTERDWELLNKNNLARIFFINKLDKENTNADKTLEELRECFGKNIFHLVSLNDPSLIEAVCEADDALLEKYLEGASLSEEEIKLGLHKAVQNAKLFPVIFGSCLQDKGIEELFDAIVKFLPSPLERPQLKLTNRNKEEKLLVYGPDKPFSAFVFKSISDPYVGQLSIIRIFAGKLISGTGFYNINKDLKERIGSIYLLQGKEQVAVTEAVCGDIVALSKLKDTSTNDSLAEDNSGLIYLETTLPESCFSESIKPKSRHDEEKISSALSKLSSEDHTFKVSRDLQTKELIVSGLGALHLDVMVARMKKRFNVDVDLGTPKIPYKETIKKGAKVQGKYKRQSGGRGQYGDVWLEIEPLPKDAEFEFVDKIFGGAIPKNYIPSVEKGVRQAMTEGALAGYPLVSVKVILYDGSFHPVDSSDMAFQIAGSMALRKAVLEAGPALLEPIMDVEILISEEFMGQISGDLNSRRGRIMGMDSRGRNQVVKAQVPLAEMFKYANDLRSMTGGRGSFTMKFSHYEEVPHKIMQEIIAKNQVDKKAEE